MPKIYTDKQKEDIFDIIIDRIRGGMSLRSTLKQDDTFSQIIWDELIKDEDKKIRYTCAREERADGIFEDILDIADNTGDDLISLSDGREVVNHELIARDKVRIDSRKWILSKMNPKKYGEKTEVEHSGEIKTKDISNLSTEELIARAEAIKKIPDA